MKPSISALLVLGLLGSAPSQAQNYQMECHRTDPNWAGDIIWEEHPQVEIVRTEKTLEIRDGEYVIQSFSNHKKTKTTDKDCESIRVEGKTLQGCSITKIVSTPAHLSETGCWTNKRTFIESIPSIGYYDEYSSLATLCAVGDEMRFGLKDFYDCVLKPVR